MVIQAIVTAVITGQGNDYIETIPCSPQINESLIPSTHDNAQVVCKSILHQKLNQTWETVVVLTLHGIQSV